MYKSKRVLVQEFIKRNHEDLLREWHVYGSRLDVDYCPGQPCNHCHTFEAYAELQYDIQMAEKARDYAEADAAERRLALSRLSYKKW